MARLISSYLIDGGKILVKTPYSDAVADQCRRWSGRWDRERDGWEVNASRLAAVQAELGSTFGDLVEVEVGVDQLDEEGAQCRVGWYILARRAGRDSAARLDAELVAGEVPARGGSAKHPLVEPSADARFRFWVPRDFAQARGLGIVLDPAASGPEPVGLGNPLAAVSTADLLAELRSRGLAAG